MSDVQELVRDAYLRGYGDGCSTHGDEEGPGAWVLDSVDAWEREREHYEERVRACLEVLWAENAALRQAAKRALDFAVIIEGGGRAEGDNYVASGVAALLRSALTWATACKTGTGIPYLLGGIDMTKLHTFQTLTTLARIVLELRVVEPNLPVSYAAIVIFVAQYRARHGEDPTVKDISDHLGMVRPSVSRATLALSGRRLGGSKATEERPEGSRKALGLLERYDDDVDLRKVRCALSDKGRGLINRLTDHIEGEEWTRGEEIE